MIRSLAMRRPAIPPRIVLIAAAVALISAAAFSAVIPADVKALPQAPAPLAQRLGVRTWALAIPTAWLAAPIPGLREDDILDLIGTRTSERATASQVAAGLRVMSVDERVVVVELTSEDASAIASARARGLSLIPIVRSVR